MKKKILIIESTVSHTPYIETLMELFSQNDKIEPYAFFNKSHEATLKKDFLEFYRKNKDRFFIDNKIYVETSSLNEMKYRISQLKQIARVVRKNKIDLIHVNTIQSKRNIPLILYLILMRKKFAITIHNTHLDSKNISDKIFKFLNKQLILKSNFLFLLGDYLKEDSFFKKKKKILINYVYDFNKKNVKKYNKITFSIIGTPNQKKGDFKKIFESFSKLLYLNKDIAKKIKLIIPIKIRSPEIIEMIKKYGLHQITEYFEEYVPEKKYLEMLRKSHYAIIPELFDRDPGERKISASFPYGCAYMLPLITPKKYLIHNKNKKDYVYEYQNDDLMQILKKLALKDYNPAVIKKQFEEYNQIHDFENINKQINSILK